MPTSPLQQVKKLYGSKEKLVDEVAGLFAPDEGESAEDFRKRLKHVANSKLLRLAKVGAAVKELGGREAIIAKVAELSGLAKDNDFVTKISSYADPKLLELHRSLSRKAKVKAAKSAS
jgi:hypothetical protein